MAGGRPANEAPRPGVGGAPRELRPEESSRASALSRPGHQWVCVPLGFVSRRPRWTQVLHVIKQEGVFLVPTCMTERNVSLYEMKIFRSVL